MKRHPKAVVQTIAFAVVVALVCALFGSCSPEKRLNRLLMKYPQLRDTVVIHDTVEAFVEYVHHDTTFLPVPGDTVTLTKDRLTVRYVLMAGDTVWLDGECAADTIRVPVRYDVPVIQPIRTVKDVPWWIWIIVGLSLALALVAHLRK
jgi:hypothetical protein